MARNFLFLLLMTVCAAPCAAQTQTRAPAVKHLCLSPAETREEIAAHRLIAPFAALKSAAGAVKAEALSAKLCRFGEEYVYEIALLRRDGRLVRVVMNAATGKFIGLRGRREPQPRK